eukprot:GHUV01046070.1.p1 GENE.GHUV01046070.1~~GHUV01046070.1.p1  ORF type:complete len:119 (-),score=16.52 GHUV01046070.1:835-1191(-)
MQFCVPLRDTHVLSGRFYCLLQRRSIRAAATAHHTVYHLIEVEKEGSFLLWLTLDCDPQQDGRYVAASSTSGALPEAAGNCLRGGMAKPAGTAGKPASRSPQEPAQQYEALFGARECP